MQGQRWFPRNTHFELALNVLIQAHEFDPQFSLPFTYFPSCGIPQINTQTQNSALQNLSGLYWIRDIKNSQDSSMGEKFGLSSPERLCNRKPSVPTAQRCHWNVELKTSFLEAATSWPLILTLESWIQGFLPTYSGKSIISFKDCSACVIAKDKLHDSSSHSWEGVTCSILVTWKGVLTQLLGKCEEGEERTLARPHKGSGGGSQVSLSNCKYFVLHVAWSPSKLALLYSMLIYLLLFKSFASFHFICFILFHWGYCELDCFPVVLL